MELPADHTNNNNKQRMGFKRRVRRREQGAEFKRVANAIHAITAARTTKNDEESDDDDEGTVTGTGTSPHKIEDDDASDSDHSESSEKSSGEHNESATTAGGADQKRVADAIHAITAARTKDMQTRTSSSPTVTNSSSAGRSPAPRQKIKDDTSDDSSEGGGGDNESTTTGEAEFDEGILLYHGNRNIYAKIKEEGVCADVYIDDIDESEFSEDVEDDVQEVFKEEDESEVSETEAYDETEFKFDEQEEEVGVGSVSINET
jgi:hypothetical protein